MAATGEIGRTPLLCVWNTDSMECIKTYTGILKRGIKYVSFSPDGTKIAALGADEDSCVVIYDINN